MFISNDRRSRDGSNQFQKVGVNHYAYVPIQKLERKLGVSNPVTPICTLE